jgi:hypothetical protein
VSILQRELTGGGGGAGGGNPSEAMDRLFTSTDLGTGNGFLLDTNGSEYWI